MKLHKPAEYVGLTALPFAFCWKVLRLNGADEILLIVLSLLSTAYFLRAFIPITEQEPAQTGTLGIFGGSIVPRVAMLACSVVIVGINFQLLHLHGSEDMLFIGCIALGITIAFAIMLLLNDREKYRFFISYLVRMIPVFLCGIYLFPHKPA